MIAVTGGTGTLGQPLVAELTSGAGPADVRVLSRRPGDGRVVGDLATGEGLAEALAGADTVVHCASDTRAFGKTDLAQARHLIAAAKSAGGPHLVYISIVGIDRVPMSYYRRKLQVEELIADSGLPWTILRATQFHNLLVDRLFGPQARLPFLVVPPGTVQPVAVEDVARSLADLATGDPQGRVDDLGGPEVLTFTEAARLYREARGQRAKTVSFPTIGAMAKSLAAGGLTCPDHRSTGQTFGEFVRAL